MQNKEADHKKIAFVGSMISICTFVTATVTNSGFFYFIALVSGIVVLGHIFAMTVIGEPPDKRR